MSTAPFNEEAIIELIRELAGGDPPELVAGIGDDAAVIAPGPNPWLVTTDLLVEGVHFKLDYLSPGDVGHRAMAANLSDIAAMGGTPRWGFLSLGLPKPPQREMVTELVSAMVALGGEHGLHLAGGDTTAAPKVTVNLCLIGEAPDSGPLVRSGARPGDAVCVTGHLGASAAGLYWFLGGRDVSKAPQSTAAHARPQPRLTAGRALAASGLVHAMMDISDGLASDLARLARASGCAAEVSAELVPISDETRLVADELRADALNWAIGGGEDFELLFTCAPDDVAALGDAVAESSHGLTVHRVGVINEGSGVSMLIKDGERIDITMGGWDHFTHGSS